MRSAMHPRARRLTLRLPRMRAATIAEFVLLALIAVQCARLFWALVTPTGPIGDWRGAEPPAPAATSLAASDPFFRARAQAGPAVVTALDLKLYGVREDRATGRGSAIIAAPDGRQGSYAVGEEIMPGVTLTGVAFDHVTITRNGAAEQIFLDQSEPAGEAAARAPAAPAAGPATPGPEAPAAAPGTPPIRMSPRTANGRVTGIRVSPGGSGDAFRAAGFAPGDVIVSVDGRPVTSAGEARAMVGGARGEVALLVDRSGRHVPFRVRLDP